MGMLEGQMQGGFLRVAWPERQWELWLERQFGTGLWMALKCGLRSLALILFTLRSSPGLLSRGTTCWKSAVLGQYERGEVCGPRALSPCAKKWGHLEEAPVTEERKR